MFEDDFLREIKVIENEDVFIDEDMERVDNKFELPSYYETMDKFEEDNDLYETIIDEFVPEEEMDVEEIEYDYEDEEDEKYDEEDSGEDGCHRLDQAIGSIFRYRVSRFRRSRRLFGTAATTLLFASVCRPDFVDGRAAATSQG